MQRALQPARFPLVPLASGLLLLKQADPPSSATRPCQTTKATTGRSTCPRRNASVISRAIPNQQQKERGEVFFQGRLMSNPSRIVLPAAAPVNFRSAKATAARALPLPLFTGHATEAKQARTGRGFTSAGRGPRHLVQHCATRALLITTGSSVRHYCHHVFPTNWHRANARSTSTVLSYLSLHRRVVLVRYFYR